MSSKESHPCVICETELFIDTPSYRVYSCPPDTIPPYFVGTFFVKLPMAHIGEQNFMCKRCYDRNRKTPDVRIDKDVFAQNYAPIKEKFKAELTQQQGGDRVQGEENNGEKKGDPEALEESTSEKSEIMPSDKSKKRKKSVSSESQSPNKGRSSPASRTQDDIAIHKRPAKQMENSRAKSVDNRNKKQTRAETSEPPKAKQTNTSHKKKESKESESGRASPSPAQIYREIWERVEREEREMRMSKKKVSSTSPTADKVDKPQNENDETVSTRVVPPRAAKNKKDDETDNESETETKPQQKTTPSNTKSGRSRTPEGYSTPRSSDPTQMSQRELRVELKRLGLSPSGLREDLVERLSAAREGRAPRPTIREISPKKTKARASPSPKSTGKRPRVAEIADNTEIIEVTEEDETPISKKAKTGAHSKKSSPSRAPTNFVIQASPNPPSPSRLSPKSRRPDTGKPRIILGLTGSVASIKAVNLTQQLSQFADVRVVTTERGTNFYDIQELEGMADVFTDEDEWSIWRKVSDPVQHIELRKWADLLIIAPMSANTLAKIANGFCDNLLTCISRAWDFGKPFLVAPAMNTYMFKHPFTEKQLGVLEGIGIEVVKPQSKKLTGGDIGTGAMADTPAIISSVKKALKMEETPLLPPISTQIPMSSVNSNSMPNFPLTSHLIHPPMPLQPSANGETLPTPNIGQNGRTPLPVLQPIIHNFLTYVPNNRT